MIVQAVATARNPCGINWCGPEILQGWFLHKFSGRCLTLAQSAAILLDDMSDLNEKPCSPLKLAADLSRFSDRSETGAAACPPPHRSFLSDGSEQVRELRIWAARIRRIAGGHESNESLPCGESCDRVLTHLDWPGNPGLRQHTVMLVIRNRSPWPGRRSYPRLDHN